MKSLPRTNVTVKCANPQCGELFETLNPMSASKHVQVRVTLPHDLAVGNCPKCNSPGMISAGSYHFDKDGLMQVFNDPAYTARMLEDIRKLAITAEKEKYTPEQFKAEATSLGIPDSFFTMAIPQDQAGFYDFLQFLASVILGILALKRQTTKIVVINKKKKSGKKKNKKRLENYEEYKLRREYNKKIRSQQFE